MPKANTNKSNKVGPGLNKQPSGLDLLTRLAGKDLGNFRAVKPSKPSLPNNKKPV